MLKSIVDWIESMGIALGVLCFIGLLMLVPVILFGGAILGGFILLVLFIKYDSEE